MPMPAASISLDSLRVFEAAARQLSFTAAALELGTTQPAISQQVKRLEAQLGARLFDRVYRGILLTEAGATLLEHVQRGLHAFGEGLEALDGGAHNEVLQVACDSAFAAFWLMPRLPRFHQSHPDIHVSLLSGERGTAQLRAPTDIAIHFGDGRSTRSDGLLLFREEVFPVASPLLLERHNGHWSHLPLLQLQPPAEARWFDWPTLFTTLGLAPPSTPGALRFDNYTLLIQAAIAGQGLAIGWRHLVDELLERRVLQRVTAASAYSAYGYYAFTPTRKRRQRLVARFSEWLQSELAAGAGGSDSAQ